MLFRVTPRRTFILMFWIGVALTSFSFLWKSGRSKNGARDKGLVEEVPEGFQPVDRTNQTYVFSAYIDVMSRGLPGILRVIGLALTNQNRRQSLFCVERTAEEVWHIKAEIERIPESHGFRYSGVFILCPLRSKAALTSVSIVSSGFVIFNYLPVHQVHNCFKVDFTVCVPPLHRNYDDLPQLIEFLEMNQILGANQFIFYNHSISPRISDILHKYTVKGLVEVVEWSLPFDAYTSTEGYVNVHYFGQLAAANDCLYRNRHKTRYIVTVDLDEFLVPRVTRSWFDLVTSLERLHPYAGEFVFQAYLFYTYLPNHSSFFSQKSMAEKYNSLTLLKTNRTLSALPVNIRPKYLYDPGRVSSVGIHTAWGFLQSFVSIKIEPTICAINHYRNAMVNPNPPGTIVDVYMHNYQDEIAKRVNSRWKEFVGITSPHCETYPVACSKYGSCG